MNSGFEGFPFADDKCHSLTIAACHQFGDAGVPTVEMRPVRSFNLPSVCGTYGLLAGGCCGYAIGGDSVSLFTPDSFVQLPLFPTDVVAITGCSEGSLISVAVAFGRTVALFRIESTSMTTDSSTHTVPSTIIDLHWTGGVDGYVVGLAESGPFTLSGIGVVAASRGAVFGSDTITFWDAEHGFAAFASGSDIEVWGCNTSWCRLSKHHCSFPIHYLTLQNGTGIAYSADGCLRTFTLDGSNGDAAVESTIRSPSNAMSSGHLSLLVSASGCDVSALSAAYPFETGSTAPMAVTSKFSLPSEVLTLRVEGETVLLLSRDGVVYEASRRPTHETLQDVVSRSGQPIVVDQWQTAPILADAAWIGLRSCMNAETRERLCEVGDTLMETTVGVGRITLAPMVRRAMFHSGPTILQGDRSSIEAHHAALVEFFVKRGWSDSAAAQGLPQSEYYFSFPDIMLRRNVSQPVQLGLQGMVLDLLVQGLSNLIRFVALVERTSPLLGSTKHHPQSVCWSQPTIYHDVVNTVLSKVGGASLLLSEELDLITVSKAKICNLIDNGDVQSALRMVSEYSVILHQDGGGGLKLIVRLLKDARPDQPMEVHVLCILLNSLHVSESNAYWLRVESILEETQETGKWYTIAKTLQGSLNGNYLSRFADWISRQTVLDPRLLVFSSCYEDLYSVGVRTFSDTPLIQVANALAFRPESLLSLARSGDFLLRERKILVELADDCDGSAALRRHLELQEELQGAVEDPEGRNLLEVSTCSASTLVELANSVRRHDIQIEVLCVDGVSDESALEDAIRLFLASDGVSLGELFGRIHNYVGSIAVTLLRVVALAVPSPELLGLISRHSSPIEAVDAVIVAVEHALHQDTSLEEWPVSHLSACEALLNTLEFSDDSQYLAMRLGDTIRRMLSLARLGHIDIKDEDITSLSEMGSRIDIPA